jgi:hypothetical protein
MPQLAQRLADALGVTVGELRELGAEGRLNAKVIVPALQTAVAGLTAELGDVPVTFGQAFTAIGNSAIKVASDFEEITGAGQSAAEALLLVAGGIEAIGDALRVVDDVLPGGFAGVGSALIEATKLAAQAAAGTAGGALGDTFDAIERAAKEAGDRRAALGAQAAHLAALGFDRVGAPVRERGPIALPGKADDGKKAAREAEKRRKEAEALAKTQREAGLDVATTFRDLGVGIQVARGEVEPFFQELIDGRAEVEALARTFVTSEAGIKAFGDNFESMFRQLTKEQGLATVREQVEGLQAQLSDFGLTEGEASVAAFNRGIDAMAESARAAGPELEALRTKGVAAIRDLATETERAAKTVTVNISGAIGGAFTNTLNSIASGDASFKAILADFGQSFVGAWTDAFGEVLALKLTSFDTKLEDNFLSDIPGIVEAGAKFMSESFGGFIDFAIKGVKDLIVWLIEAVNWQAVLAGIKAIGGGVLGLVGLAEGGIVSSPGVFAIAESGPEAVIPLDRLAGMTGGDGMRGGDGDGVTINIIDNVGVQKRQERRRDGGARTIDLFLEAVANDVRTGGRVGRSIDQTRGTRQIATLR